jgi:hypothetical protein
MGALAAAAGDVLNASCQHRICKKAAEKLPFNSKMLINF